MQIDKIVDIEKRREALKLAVDVFMQYEAPDYSGKGIESFKNFINTESINNKLEMYVTYKQNNIVGVIASRNNGNHISLFFVDGKYHRQGIGKNLFQKVLTNSTADEITVNSSPYAVEIYRKLGFVAMESEQLTDGIRYVPMKYKKRV